MVTRIAEWVYNASLAELRKGSAGNKRRSKLLRKARRLLLKLADPDIFARLDGFLFRTPFSSNIILYHFDSPLYDSALPRLAWAVSAARGGLMMVDVGANVGAATYLVSQKTTGRFFCRQKLLDTTSRYLQRKAALDQMRRQTLPWVLRPSAWVIRIQRDRVRRRMNTLRDLGLQATPRSVASVG